MQLMSFGERRVADIETGGDSSLVTELLAGQTPLFHANMCAWLCDVIVLS